VTNHDLFTIRFYYTKAVNSTRLCSGGPSRLPGSPNRIPQKIHPSISQGRFFSQHGVALALSKENVPSRLLPNLCSFFHQTYFSTSPIRSSEFALYIANFRLNRLLISFYHYCCHLLASYRPPQRSFPLIKMGRPKDPKNFVERARQKGSEKNTIHINGSEVQSHLEPKTRRSYQRQVDNWYQ
jgi:hypothetical protein